MDHFWILGLQYNNKKNSKALRIVGANNAKKSG